MTSLSPTLTQSRLDRLTARRADLQAAITAAEQAHDLEWVFATLGVIQHVDRARQQAYRELDRVEGA